MERRSRGKNSLNKARLEKKREKEMASTNPQIDNYRLLFKACRAEEKTAVRTTPNTPPNIAILA